MPDDALPRPWPAAPPNTVSYRREFRDALGRPMRGTLTVSGAKRADSDEMTLVAAPVNVALDGGVLELRIPAGDYTLAGWLTTVDGSRVQEEFTITLRAERDSR